jgi:sulfite reductase alpha subunit-like flavoprotein
MGHDVQKAIIDIINEAQCVSTEEATKVFESLQAEGRYIQELWS